MQYPDHSAAEIAGLPELCTEEWDRHIQAVGLELSAETLVFLTRELAARGENDREDVCIEYLVGLGRGNGSAAGRQCDRAVRWAARKAGITNAQDYADFRANCVTRMIEQVRAERGRYPFWEECFDVTMKARAIDEARAFGRSMRIDRLVDDDADFDNLGDNSAGIDDHIIGELQHSTLLSLIKNLPPDLAEAASLVWVHRFDTESVDSEKVTAATILQITGRAVRKRIERAKGLLREMREFQDILRDHGL